MRGLKMLALAAAAMTLVGACGSNGSSNEAASTTTTAAPTTTSEAKAPADEAAAKAEITTAFEKFFSSDTPEAEVPQYTQSPDVVMPLFKQALASQANMTRGAKVTKIVFTSATTADVTFDVLVNGDPALPNTVGSAVLEGGSWKVSLTTTCDLVALTGLSCPGEGGTTESTTAGSSTPPGSAETTTASS